MEGFGSSSFTTPFNYGSVKDGYTHNPSLEQRLKKKYWKTKQTVRQKLNKQEDEFVVAGDAAIDSKLEVARHLGSSCSRLIMATRRSIYHNRQLSAYERALGNYLSSCGELDFTLAGQIMSKTGEMHKKHAETRLKQLPSIMRLQAETSTFANSGLGDLNYSIENLERARKDYRAALLWMKDVSEKLHNPDAKGQLVRFREAQAQVKITKERFDHLKELLSEKIQMVRASRCNLLSNVLPVYQNAILEYLDQSANDLFKVLTDLRSQTQHQYKVKDLSMEIRDLEGMEDIGSPELGEMEQPPTEVHNQDDTATQSTGTLSVPKPKKEKKENALFGLLQGEIMSMGAAVPQATPSMDPTPPTTQTQKDTNETTPTSDNDKNKDSVDPDPSTQDDATPPQPTPPPNDQFDDLLSLLDAPLESYSLEPGKAGGDNDEWNTFMDKQEKGGEEDGDGKGEGEDESGWGELVRHVQSENHDGGWSQNIIEGDENVSKLEEEIDKMLSLDESIASDLNNEESAGATPLHGEDSFDPLMSDTDNVSSELEIKENNPLEDNDELKLDPSLFQQQSTPTGGATMAPPLMPLNSSPLAILPTQHGPSTPQQPHPHHMNPFPSLPYTGMGVMPLQYASGMAMTSTGMHGPATQPMGSGHHFYNKTTTNGSKDDDSKKKKWSNVFAHLDPIANEKA